MPFVTQWFHLILNQANAVLLVLDGSDSTADQRLALALLDNLSRAVAVWVAFLGGEKIYTRTEINSQWRTLIKEQRRLRTLAPVIHTTKASQIQAQFVVLGRGTIFDLEDFVGDPVLQNARFVRCADATITQGLFPEELPHIEALANSLDNSALHLSIPLRGQLPIFWPSNLDWDGEALSGSLCSQSSSEPLDFAWIGETQCNAEASVRYRDGSLRHVPLHTREPPKHRASWKTFSPVESKILSECLSRGSYQCPVCNDTHRAGDFFCEKGRGLGTPVISSVPETTRAIMVRGVRAEFEWRALDTQGVVLDDGVRLFAGKQPGFFRYESSQWRRVESERRAFWPLKGGEFLVQL